MTFVEMQTDALDLLHEIQSHGQYSLAKLKGYLNRGNITFVRKTKAIEGMADITTVANQFEYDSSDASDLSNVMMPYEVRYGDVATEVGEKLVPWPGGHPNLPKDYSYGIPYWYWMRNVHGVTRAAIPSVYVGIRVGTWPIASVADKIIRIYSFYRPATLVDDEDVPEIHEEWHDAIVYYAVSRIFGMFGHLKASWEKKSIFYMSEFERVVADANEFMSIQSDEPMEIQDAYYEMDR